MKEYKTVAIGTNQGWYFGAKGTADTTAIDDVFNRMGRAG
jgi:hypothetical protein